MAGAEPDACLLAVALDGRGRPCACAGAVTTDGLASVAFVATLSHARGRGMAAACIRSCLARARAREGATATVLEATKIGEPRYARMGYRPLGALGMWEHRSAGSDPVPRAD
jgi:ribosomal protein S18 acetylase RimI-like enzyme